MYWKSIKNDFRAMKFWRYTAIKQNHILVVKQFSCFVWRNLVLHMISAGDIFYRYTTLQSITNLEPFSHETKSHHCIICFTNVMHEQIFSMINVLFLSSKLFFFRWCWGNSDQDFLLCFSNSVNHDSHKNTQKTEGC